MVKGLDHAKVNAELNRRAGVEKVALATIDEPQAPPRRRRVLVCPLSTVRICDEPTAVPNLSDCDPTAAVISPTPTWRCSPSRTAAVLSSDHPVTSPRTRRVDPTVVGVWIDRPCRLGSAEGKEGPISAHVGARIARLQSRAGCGNRTHDIEITSFVLCQLS